MSFAVTDERGRLRVREHVAERAVRQARAPRDAVVPPHGRRPRALQPRGAGAARDRTATGPSLGHFLEERALLARVRRPADRAPGRRRLVGRPAPDVELPGALPDRVLRQPRDARLPRPPAVAHGRRRLAPLRRGARARRGATACGSRTPVESVQPPRRPRRRSRRAAARPSASTTSSSPRTPTRRWRCSPTPTRPRARAARRDPLPAQRGGAAHRRARCCRAAAARGRAGTTTCSTSRPASRP